MNNTILKGLIITMTLAFLWSVTMWSKEETMSDTKTQTINSLNHKIDSLTSLSDSLTDEIFINKVTNGRYELSLEYLKEINPKAAESFENYLNTQTE